MRLREELEIGMSGYNRSEIQKVFFDKCRFIFELCKQEKSVCSFRDFVFNAFLDNRPLTNEKLFTRMASLP